MPDYQSLLAEKSQHWTAELVGTLLFVQQGSDVLLIRKKRGHGAGKIIGPGGKVEPGETPTQSAIRELHEEVGLVAQQITERARIKFIELDGPQWFGHIFTSPTIEGNPIETDEAIPLWFPQQNLPLDQMWPDDKYWLPRILAGEYLYAEFLFRAGDLLAHNIRSMQPWTT